MLVAAQDEGVGIVLDVEGADEEDVHGVETYGLPLVRDYIPGCAVGWCIIPESDVSSDERPGPGSVAHGGG